MRLFGFSEVSGRGFSVLFLGLALLVLMRFASLQAPTEAFPAWVLLVFGVSTSCYLMTREARMYTMAFFFVCVSLSLTLSLVSRCMSLLPLVSLTTCSRRGLWRVWEKIARRGV